MNLCCSCSTLGPTWAWQLSPRVDMSSWARAPTSSTLVVFSSSSARRTCSNNVHLSACAVTMVTLVFQQEPNLQDAIVGSLTLNVLQLPLRSVHPLVHFLDLSVQFLHLTLVILGGQDEKAGLFVLRALRD